MDRTLFLDTEKKVWKVEKLEIPVIENVPMNDLKWFREKTKEIETLRETNKLTVKKGLEVDEEWWENTCKVGLGKTMSQVLASGISEPKFRMLMAEVFHFLQNFGTIEEAKRSGIYDPEIQTKEDKQ
jgi:hypothetical protein